MKQEAMRAGDLAAELARAREQQAAVSDVLAAITRVTGDATPAFDTILAHAARLCDADRATLALRDGDTIRVAAGLNLSPAAMERLKRGFPVDRGTTSGRAVVEGRTLRWDDVTTDPELSEEARVSLTLTESRSVLTVPLMEDGHAIGAINLRRITVRPFTDDETDPIEMADHEVCAVRMAVAMRDRFAEIAAPWKRA